MTCAGKRWRQSLAMYITYVWHAYRYVLFSKTAFAKDHVKGDRILRPSLRALQTGFCSPHHASTRTYAELCSERCTDLDAQKIQAFLYSGPTPQRHNSNTGDVGCRRKINFTPISEASPTSFFQGPFCSVESAASLMQFTSLGQVCKR